MFWCFPCSQCQIQRHMLNMREQGASAQPGELGNMHETGKIYLFQPDTTNSTDAGKTE